METLSTIGSSATEYKLKPLQENMVHWAKASFDAITQNTINKIWKTIGILPTTTTAATNKNQTNSRDHDGNTRPKLPLLWELRVVEDENMISNHWKDQQDTLPE
jgi:hypothetical protein